MTSNIPFPSAAVDAAAPLPWVPRESIHMEDMGLWRPSMDSAECT